MARITKISLAASAAFGLALLSGVAFAQESAQPQAQQSLPAIVVTKVERRQMVDRVIATGVIKAVDETDVAPLVDGLWISALHAEVGDRVAAGTTLANLNEDTLVLQKSQNEANLAKARASLAQYQAQLVEARANADEAKRTAERSERLAASGSMSTAQRDQEKAAADAAIARVNSAEQLIAVAEADIRVVETQISDVDLRLARTEVKAPVGGIVSARNARIGAIASGSGEPLFTIIRDGELEMRAEIPEVDLVRLEPGQKAVVYLAGGHEAIVGHIRIISPAVDTQSRLGTVYVALDDSKKARIGMYANARITISESEALSLPLSAVTRSIDGEMIVRKVDGTIVHTAKIETGVQESGFIEIRSGLNDGDTVVSKAGAFVRDGDHIKPISADKTAATN